MEEARELQQVQSHVMGEFKMIVTLREGSDIISSVVWKRNAIQCLAAKVLKHFTFTVVIFILNLPRTADHEQVPKLLFSSSTLIGLQEASTVTH